MNPTTSETTETKARAAEHTKKRHQLLDDFARDETIGHGAFEACGGHYDRLGEYCDELASDRDRLAKELAQERAKLQAAERVVNAAREVTPYKVLGHEGEAIRKAIAVYDRATKEDGSRAGGAGKVGE